eukprot:14733586-Alexandrium_andersonii.AAC.1
MPGVATPRRPRRAKGPCPGLGSAGKKRGGEVLALRAEGGTLLTAPPAPRVAAEDEPVVRRF